MGINNQEDGSRRAPTEILGQQQATDDYNNNRGAKGGNYNAQPVAGGESAEDIKTKLARFKRERDQLDAVRQKFSAKEGSTTIQSVDMKENLVQ